MVTRLLITSKWSIQYVETHADGHRIAGQQTVLMMVIILVTSGYSDFSSPCGSYVVKHADGYHLAGHQTVDHKLRGPYMVKHTGWSMHWSL